MKIIGLCGSSGSGKGYISNAFSKYDIPAIDTDRVYREITTKKGTPCLLELANTFGKEILNENGELDRKKLATIVFEGEGAKQRLEKLDKIAHRYIKIDTENIINQYKNEGKIAVIIDAPVLFESGFDKMCDFTICVIAPLEMKLERIIKRDNITREKALARLNSQLSNEELIKLSTYQIDNSNVGLNSQIEDILKREKLITKE
ncbi:MAG: dephospho-CoA kinase [Clostridia bacterium]|nr:dephospho-CoA kinase [Clostridia bacterium]